MDQQKDNKQGFERFCDNYLLDLLSRIDRMQKEAILNQETACVSCTNTLTTFQNNTLPISFLMRCGGYLTVNIGITDTTTTYFRIESIRCDRFITLRLLEAVGDTLEATVFTITLDLECVCGVQCFNAISVTPCETV